MRINDIDFGKELFINLNIVSKNVKEKNIQNYFNKISAYKVIDDTLLLDCKGVSKDTETMSVIELKAKTETDIIALQKLNNSKDLAFIKPVKITNNHAYIGIRIFSDKIEYINETFPISLTPDFVLQAKNAAEKEFKDIVSFMKQEFLLDDKQIFIQPALYSNRPDIMIGKTYTCELVSSQESKMIFASNLKKKHKNQIDNIRHINILSGNISFIDGRKEIKDAARRTFNNNVKVNSEFEKIWLAYNEAYLESAKAEVDRVGYFEYRAVSHTSPTKFYLKDDFNPIRDKAFLESDLGYAIIDKKHFDSAIQEDERNSNLSELLDKMTRSNLKIIFLADKIDWNPKDNSIVRHIEPDDLQPFPENGYIIPSYYGSKTMKIRREKAYERIQQMENPMPSLRNLIAFGKSDQVFSPKHRTPVNDKMLRKIFGSSGNKFTERQREAIDIAINTPDVAIIQGPPGTGKTTIIRAIVERLNELYPEDLRILISSTQHDAVDNAISGMTCAGMPAVRIGGKIIDEGKSQLYKAKWIKQLEDSCDEILKNEPENRNRLKQRHIYHLIDTIRKQNIDNINANRERIKELHHFLREIGYEGDNLNKLTEITNRFIDAKYERQDAVESGREFQSILEQQRLEKDDYLKDGRAYLIQLMMAIEMDDKIKFKVPEHWNIIRRASIRRIPEGFDEAFTLFVEDINHLKKGDEESVCSENNLLIRKDIEDLLDEIKQYVDEQAKHDRTIYDVIWDFRDKISNPGNIDRVLQRYSKVKAATCQQSVSNQVGTLEFSRLGNDREYHYVIIDEAARSNPLDLIIPMSLGQHVILVGDHKQLPHMLESDVLDSTLAQYDSNLRKEKESLLKESLFQRLYRQLSEQTDGKRVTTLREQYRMHPTIGQFVSDCFYEGKLISEIPASSREHNTGMFNNKPIAWIDVTKDVGLEDIEKDGYSYYRKSEVDRIMNIIKNIAHINNEFSIGIITFYKAQENLFKTALDSLPDSITIRTEIGTVDAFQGKEFDIVFLSTVRCNRKSDKRKSVGFLANVNRLNVAFSRAKRLLVCVGDHETVAKNDDIIQIPSFARFYDLCREDGYYEQ